MFSIEVIYTIISRKQHAGKQELCSSYCMVWECCHVWMRSIFKEEREWGCTVVTCSDCCGSCFKSWAKSHPFSRFGYQSWCDWAADLMNCGPLRPLPPPESGDLKDHFISPQKDKAKTKNDKRARAYSMSRGWQQRKQQALGAVSLLASPS